MKFKLLFLVAILTSVFVVQAQNFAADTTYSKEISEKKSYRLDADTLWNPTRCASDILRSKDPLTKSGFLSHYNMNLKSIFSEDWKLDSVVSSFWDVQNQSVKPLYWQVFNTLEEKLNFEIRNYKMDEEKGHWTIAEAQYYRMNGDGLLDSAEFQTHVTLNYILYKKYTYTYENGRLQSEISQEKFDEFEDWQYLNRFKYEYDSLGRLERVYTQEKDLFNDDFWTSFEYVEYTYDSLNNVIRETYFDYEDYDMVSTKTSELAYSYDDQNRLETVVEYVESWQAGIFVEEAKSEYFYDEDNRLIQLVISHWDYDINNWLGFIRNSQKFNLGHDTLMVLETEFWDQTWILRDRAVYQAPNSIQSNSIQSTGFIFSFLPIYEQDGIVCENISNFEWENTEWLDRGATMYYFSQIEPVDVPTVLSSSVKIYPNPVSSNLVIEGNDSGKMEVRIHDMNGRLLIQKSTTGNDLIHVQTLPSGIYFIEIVQDGKKISSDKFIKK